MEDINFDFIPRNAYRFWPKENLVKTGTGKTLIRYIFYRIDFSEYEKSQVLLFKTYINTANPQLLLPQFYSDAELLRILLGCRFNLKKSYEGLISSIIWRSANLTNSYHTLYPLCSELLNSGCIYFHGRDHRFRPLLVINIERFNFSEISIDSYCHLLCFLLEFAIQKLMLPGQIENWIVICDLCNKGLTKLPLSDLKNIIKTLQDNFRCRMTVNYLLNCPSSIYFMWQIIKKFIEEHTIRKIKIEKIPNPPEIFSQFNRSQVEMKYGGSAPNATQFWPPVFPEGSLETEEDSIEKYLTDRDTYFEYFREPSEISSRMDSVSEKVDFSKELKKHRLRASCGTNYLEARQDAYSYSYTLENMSHTENKSVIESNYKVSAFSEQSGGILDEDEEPKNIEIIVNKMKSLKRNEEPATEHKKSNLKKYCKICTKRPCGIF